MAMGIVPVAMSLELAYSVLPSMIYDKKREGGISDFTICPLALFHIVQQEFRGIGLTATAHIWFGDIARPFPCQQPF